MCFLGTAGKIGPEDVNLEDIKKAEIIFLEGYLWDEGDPKKLLIKLSRVQVKKRCLCQICFV